MRYWPIWGHQWMLPLPLKSQLTYPRTNRRWKITWPLNSWSHTGTSTSMKLQNRGILFLSFPRTANPQLTHNNSTIKFMDGESVDYALVTKGWAIFLYVEESGWNINDVRRGLFHGHVLARASVIHPTPHHLNLGWPPMFQVTIRQRSEMRFSLGVQPRDLPGPRVYTIPEGSTCKGWIQSSSQPSSAYPLHKIVK